MTRIVHGPVHVHPDEAMEEFDVSISYGLQEVSLNDHLNFVMGIEGFGSHQTVLRKREATSPFYDGTFVTHFTKENVTETLEVYVTGFSQNHVTENLLFLEELFLQPSYRIQVRIDDHLETWSCFPADYSVDRSHINMHNVRAVFTATVPRLPKVSYEAIL